MLPSWNSTISNCSTKPRREDTIVDIREDGNKGIKIPGLTEMDITSVEQTMALLEKASEGRVTAATAMNARSSRSHHSGLKGEIQKNVSDTPSMDSFTKIYIDFEKL